MQSAVAREWNSCFRYEVTDPAEGANRIAPELAAQGMHVNFDRVAADRFVPAIQPVFELGARQHRARTLHQRFQHGVLVRRQADRCTAALHPRPPTPPPSRPKKPTGAPPRCTVRVTGSSRSSPCTMLGSPRPAAR